jgi:peptidoglycan/LPS O-acetylase OafA/YrhL
MEAPTSPAPARNFFVDVLRGIAILGVMWLHLQLPPWLEARLPAVATTAIHGGLYGVTVFFVISGYLIATTSINRFGSLPAMDIGKFAVFRFGRIFPFLLLVLALLVSMGVNGAIGFTFGSVNAMLDATASVLSFQYNDYYTHHNPYLNPWNVMWSLSIEELFYIFLPIVCRTLRSTRLIAVWLLFAVPYAYYARTGGDNLFMFSGCVDALAIGVLTAILGARKTAKDHRVLASLGMGLGLAAIFYVWQFGKPTGSPQRGPLLCSIGAAIFIYSSLYFPAISFRRSSGRSKAPVAVRGAALVLGSPLILLSVFGRVSYEAYLLHMPLLELKRNYLWTKYDRLLLYAFVGVAAYLVNRYFTEPMNRIVRGDTKQAAGRTVWARLRAPAFVALTVLIVPNVIVARDLRHPRHLVSVSTKVNLGKLSAVAMPLVAYGEAGTADFLSVRRSDAGSVELQFDHWGAPPVVRAVSPDLVKNDFTVVLDCVSPAVTIDGVQILSKADLQGFTSHDVVAIGKNDIGAITMAADAGEVIASASMTFNNGDVSPERSWKRPR